MRRVVRSWIMILPRPELDEESSDVERDVCDVPDEFPVGIDQTAVEPLCLSVVIQTRPQFGCDPDLPLPVDKGKESLVEDGPDVIFSGGKLNVKISVVGSVFYRISLRLLCPSRLWSRWSYL